MRQKYNFIPNEIVGILTVLDKSDKKMNDSRALYRVKCNECGYEYELPIRDIHKIIKKCHHVRADGETYINNYVKWYSARLRKIYDDMCQRCYNLRDKTYRWYGAKGIRVCQSWLDNPELFQTWALKNGYADNLTINRKDEDKDYCPENCEWITAKNNAKYKSTTYILEVDGEEHTGREWSDVLKLGTNTINTYLRKYDEEIVKQFIRERKKNLNAYRKSKQTWLDVYGISDPDENIEV